MGKNYYTNNNKKWYLKNGTHKKNKGKLNKQHYDFVYYYCLTNNPFKSAINAGYSRSYAHRKGKELLENDKIMELIIEQKNEMIKQNGIVSQDIVRKYIDIAFADIGNYVEIENGTIDIRDSKNLDYSLIKKISRDKQGTTIELEDKQKALQWLAEYYLIDSKHNLNIRKADQEDKLKELERMVNEIVESKKV